MTVMARPKIAGFSYIIPSMVKAYYSVYASTGGCIEIEDIHEAACGK